MTVDREVAFYRLSTNRYNQKCQRQNKTHHRYPIVVSYMHPIVTSPAGKLVTLHSHCGNSGLCTDMLLGIW